MFESIWTNIRVAGYAVRDKNGSHATFPRSFAHIVDPVLLSKSCKHEGCAAEKARSCLGLELVLLSRATIF